MKKAKENFKLIKFKFVPVKYTKPVRATSVQTVVSPTVRKQGEMERPNPFSK